jgi:glycosyltransferase involved in cell wall biosynthesis
MRVLQLIDSLDAGGAERVAVSYTNALDQVIEASYICTTRKEGILKDTIEVRQNYLFLNKKSTFDLLALRRLIRFVKKNKINLIHAHSSSYFFATMVKLYVPDLKLIWHDHYGKSEDLSSRNFKVLRWCSTLFCAVISVNHILQDWAKEKLKTKTVHYLKNAVTFPILSDESTFKLQGESGKRIVCLANLRPQKDHENLLKAFKKISDNYPGYSLHLLGQDWNDAYNNKVLYLVEQFNLQNDVHFYGSQPNVAGILQQCDIGVLSSRSEGLPLALLEYGMMGLPVVCTDVGFCFEVVNGFGKCVESENPESLANALIHYIEHPIERQKEALLFNEHIIENYSINRIIPKLVSYYEACN